MRKSLLLAVLSLLATTSLSAQQPNTPLRNYTPVTDAMLKSPPDADWLQWRRTDNNWAHSPLTQVNKQNIGSLSLAWSWNIEAGTSEPTPIVHDGVMFMYNPDSIVQALDAATGNLLWEYRREMPQGSPGGINLAKRNITVYDDKVYLATTDTFVVALDAKTGQLVWETRAGDYKQGVTFTISPIVADGVLVSGTTGCSQFRPDRSGCYLMGHDAKTGKEMWRVYTVAIDGEPGGDTWGGIPDNFRAGGSIWIPCTYDSALNQVLCGTAQPYPWPRVVRGTGDGAALYTNSTLAIEPKTGKVKWHHQYVPGETLDLDEVFEHVLIDVGNQKRFYKIGKGGIMWVMERETGLFVSHREMVFNNVYDIDPKLGQARVKDSAIPKDLRTPVFSCPSTAGGKDWHPMAYNPELHTLFMPLSQTCMNFTATQVQQRVGGGGSGGVRTFAPMPGAKGQGKVTALNVETMQPVWEFEQHAPFLTGMLSTAGGLVFVGDLDRYFKAFDAANGQVLWQTRLSQSVQGMPITYSVNGIQYIAVPVGLGGGSPRAQSALVPDIKIPASGNNLFVFALRDQAASAR